MIKMTASDLAAVLCNLLAFEREERQEKGSHTDRAADSITVRRSSDSSKGIKTDDHKYDISDDDIYF